MQNKCNRKCHETKHECVTTIDSVQESQKFLIQMLRSSSLLLFINNKYESVAKILQYRSLSLIQILMNITHRIHKQHESGVKVLH